MAKCSKISGNGVTVWPTGASWLKPAELAATFAGAAIDLVIGGQPLVPLATASAALAVVGDDLIPFVSELQSVRGDRPKAKGDGTFAFCDG
jgi:hypothetical protein